MLPKAATIRNRRAQALLFAAVLAALILIATLTVGLQIRQVSLNQRLIAAVDRNDPAAVRRLLREGSDPNASIYEGHDRTLWKRWIDRLRGLSRSQSPTRSSILIRAAGWLPSGVKDPPIERGHMNPEDIELPPAVDNAATIRALLDDGARVNFRSAHRHETPILAAARVGKFDSVQALLAHGADVNAVDSSGGDALYYAASYANAAAVEGLMRHGVHVDRAYDTGETPLVIADRNNLGRPPKDVLDTVACLLRHGASILGNDPSGAAMINMISGDDDDPLIAMLRRAADQQLRRRGLGGSTAAPKTVVDFYLHLPAKYFEETYPQDDLNVAARRFYLQNIDGSVVDIKNGYLRMTGDGAQPTITVCLFRRPDRSYVIAVGSGDDTGERDLDLNLYDYRNGRWRDITRQVLPVVVNPDWAYVLPHYGRTIHVLDKAKRRVYDLVWTNGVFRKVGGSVWATSRAR